MTQNEFISRTGINDGNVFCFANTLYLFDERVNKDDFCEAFKELSKCRLFKTLLHSSMDDMERKKRMEEEHKKSIESLNLTIDSKDATIYDICVELCKLGHEYDDENANNIAVQHMGVRQYLKFIINEDLDFTDYDKERLNSIL